MKKGMLFKRRDGERIGDPNMNFTCKVRDFVTNDDGSYKINNKYVFFPDDIVEIDKNSFLSGQVSIPKRSKPKDKCEIVENNITNGCYVRKNSWELFKENTRPTLLVTTFHFEKYKPNSITIHRSQYQIDKLIVLTKEEHEAIDAEFTALRVSPAEEDNPLEKACIREATGQSKVGYDTEKDVIKALWAMKHRHPNLVFEAYNCKYCKKFHIGKPEKKKLETV